MDIYSYMDIATYIICCLLQYNVSTNFNCGYVITVARHFNTVQVSIGLMYITSVAWYNSVCDHF